MYAYGISQRGGKFPAYSSNGPNAQAFGFARIPRPSSATQEDPPDPALLNGNITAALWLLVRDESTDVKSWLCASDPSSEADQLTVILGAGESRQFLSDKPVRKINTWDFGMPECISFSPVNPYHAAIGSNWSLNVKPEWVLMGDDNNADEAAGNHALERGVGEDWKRQEFIQARENSTNHKTAGQNLLFGDGHVEFVTDPFRGPGHDNVNAMKFTGGNGPPKLGNSDGDPAASNDVVLIPITGNQGVNLGKQ